MIDDVGRLRAEIEMMRQYERTRLKAQMNSKMRVRERV
jgi:hypothetical protein